MGVLRRRFLILLGGLPVAIRAQSRSHRVGYLTGNEPSTIAAFDEELARLGYRLGDNLVIERRISRANSSDGTTQARELAQLDLDVVVAAALPQALELRTVIGAAPMVIATCPGMVSNGFAMTLDHPGGSVTGMDELPPGVTTKRLTLLKTVAPTIGRIALFSTTPGRGGHEAQLAEAEQSAAALNVTVKPYRVTSLNQFDAAFSAIMDDGMNGLLSFQGGLALINRERIIQFAAARKLPAIYQATLFAESGGLMTWAPDLDEQFRHAARLVDQILRGAHPGELPIEYPARYYLTINTGTAKTLGMPVPSALLSQADRVLP